MMHLLLAVRRLSDFLLAWLMIVVFGALTIDVLWGVFSRYVLAAQSPWTDELATTLMIWLAFLGAAYVYGEKGHLGVDYFVGKLDLSAGRVTVFSAHALVLFFSAVVMVYGGWVMVNRTLAAGQELPALGWEKGYVYSVVPLSGAFLVFYAIEGMAEVFHPPARKNAATADFDSRFEASSLPE
jgi:TRAP-type C4-dicarboxylate transport system permease small subunit